MSVCDKVMLRKRSLIETIIDQLKNIVQIEHSRHRCFTNFVSNLFAALCAYNFAPKTSPYKLFATLLVIYASIISGIRY